MRAVVVFESMFGNTEAVARAVANGISSVMGVDILEVSSVPVRFGGVSLLVVGAPTHAFGMSRPRTRDDARARGSRSVAGGIGVREWLESLGRPAAATAAATFDTRIDKPRVPGSAARAAEKRLRRLGFRVTAAESFYVEDVAGPLVQGEDERARRWGEHLARQVNRATVDVAGAAGP